MADSALYSEKKARLGTMLTVYGRKPALEALQDASLACHALHLADNNREGGIIAELTALAGRRNVPVSHHSRAELARISKNGKQDQGVALDVLCPAFEGIDSYLLERADKSSHVRLLALDGISNPANLGMIIRSAAAGAVDGIICPRRGNAALGPLVIKASAGTVYRAPLLRCESLPEALRRCLRWRLPGYDPSVHLGGVLYLFLRGMAGPATPDGCGVFSWHPSADVIVALSDLLDGRRP